MDHHGTAKRTTQELKSFSRKLCPHGPNRTAERGKVLFRDTSTPPDNPPMPSMACLCGLTCPSSIKKYANPVLPSNCREELGHQCFPIGCPLCDPSKQADIWVAPFPFCPLCDKKVVYRLSRLQIHNPPCLFCRLRYI